MTIHSVVGLHHTYGVDVLWKYTYLYVKIVDKVCIYASNHCSIDKTWFSGKSGCKCLASASEVGVASEKGANELSDDECGLRFVP